MRFLGFDITRAPAVQRKDGASFDVVLRRLVAAYEGASGVSVTPESCMASPTVAAIVTAISRRIAVLPVRVYKTITSKGRTRKEEVPSHPVQKLLENPNPWQDRTAFWLDAASWLVRYGNFYAYKSRGSTGPIRQLVSLPAGHVNVIQDMNLDVTYQATQAGGVPRIFSPNEIMHARGPARDGLKGDSPVIDLRDAIALEIAAERMGSSVFGNNAMPGIIFKHASTSAGFETDEEEKKFIEDFEAAYGKKGRFKSMVLPFGMDVDTLGIDNEKAQFLATRQYQRTVIAGAFGVPPHMVGDLTKMTFGNVEQQSLDFVINVVLPYVRIFESAMERSLLTDEDRRAGIIIRFNLDAALRGTFKERQEGLKIQREMGVISPNDWRERENMNPLTPEDGGDDYWRKGPSGQDAAAPGNEPPADGNEPSETEPPEESDNDTNA